MRLSWKASAADCAENISSWQLRFWVDKKIFTTTVFCSFRHTHKCSDTGTHPDTQSQASSHHVWTPKRMHTHAHSRSHTHSLSVCLTSSGHFPSHAPSLSFLPYYRLSLFYSSGLLFSLSLCFYYLFLFLISFSISFNSFSSLSNPSISVSKISFYLGKSLPLSLSLCLSLSTFVSISFLFKLFLTLPSFVLT